MILTEQEIKQYIPVATLTVSYLDKHETRAILKHLPKYLGLPLTKQLLLAEPPAAIVALITELKGAIANLTYCEATPFIDLVSTNTGFGVISNQNIAPASQQRVKAFADAALKAAEDFLSDALMFLEQNAADYPTWNKSSIIEGGIISSIDEWPVEIDINYSRVKFVNLASALKTAEKLYLAKTLSAEFVASIVGTDELNVLPDITKALAFYSMYLSQKAEDSKNTEFFTKAQAYMESAQDYLQKHLLEYPIYATYGYEAPFANNLDDYGFLQMG